jgi:hypothetical protein
MIARLALPFLAAAGNDHYWFGLSGPGGKAFRQDIVVLVVAKDDSKTWAPGGW